MKVYYSEFEATRKYGIGWDIEELSGEHKSDTRRALATQIDRISNSFPYYAYPEHGYFLYYDDYLKQFICVQGSEGERIDHRVNMTLNIRVPEDVKDNGFWESLQLIGMWNGKTLQKQNVAQICEKYHLTITWLESFANALYEQAFSVAAKAMQIVTPCLLDDDRSDSEFVMDMMQVCYALVPTSKLSRLSFGWNIPEDKMGDARILFHKTKQLPKAFDLAEEPKAVEHKYQGMIARIVKDVLEDSEEEGFQDKIDQYYIKLTNYESLYWNYCYYLLEEENNFTCSMEEFKAIREDLKKQMQNQFAKAEALYESIVKHLLTQELKQEEIMMLLIDSLVLYNKKKELSDEALETLWELMLAYAKQNEKTVLKLLKEIKQKYTKVYQPLMKLGISQKYIDFDSFMIQEKLLTRDSIDAWIEDAENKAFLEESIVKEKLMGVLAPYFDEQASLKEIQLLIEAGSKIDREACFKLFQDYMKNRVDVACKKQSMLAYVTFMKETSSLWSKNSCKQLIEEGCDYLVSRCTMPVDTKELCAFTKIEDNLSNLPQIQRTLVKLCREYLEETLKKNPQMELALETLTDWQTGLSANDGELVLAKKYLKKCKMHYEPDDFFKDDEIIVDEPKEVEKTEKNLEGEQFSTTELMTFFKKMLLGKTAREDIQSIFQILALAEYYLDEDEMSELVGCVWEVVQVNQFPSLYKTSIAFQKGEMKEDLVKYGNHPLRSVYEIYYDLHENKKIKYIVKHMEEVFNSEAGPYAEELLELFIKEWPSAKDETFANIEQILRICWDDTEELLRQAERVLHTDIKVKRIRARMQNTDSAQGKVEQLFSGIKAKFVNEKKGK